MTHKERMTLLKQWESQIFAVDNLRKNIEAVFGDCIESEFFRVISNLEMKYTRVMAELIGDADWMEWYWFENDMGARGHEAKASNWKKLRKVTNIEVLCKLIEADIE